MLQSSAATIKVAFLVVANLFDCSRPHASRGQKVDLPHRYSWPFPSTDIWPGLALPWLFGARPSPFVSGAPLRTAPYILAHHQFSAYP